MVPNELIHGVESRYALYELDAPARRAQSDNMIGSSSHTTASRPSARSTVRVDDIAAVMASPVLYRRSMH